MESLKYLADEFGIFFYSFFFFPPFRQWGGNWASWREDWCEIRVIREWQCHTGNVDEGCIDGGGGEGTRDRGVTRDTVEFCQVTGVRTWTDKEKHEKGQEVGDDTGSRTIRTWQLTGSLQNKVKGILPNAFKFCVGSRNGKVQLSIWGGKGEKQSDSGRCEKENSVKKIHF